MSEPTTTDEAPFVRVEDGLARALEAIAEADEEFDSISGELVPTTGAGWCAPSP